jgi:two-component system KDP operon response regulator KdpE
MSAIKVIVIDDDDGIQELVKNILNEDGWDTYAAVDGPQGIAYIESESPDLVLLDLKLPGIDGFEVCRRIRQFSQIPIIALSALISLEDRKTFLLIGGNDYITKPFTSDELRFRVWTNLQYSRQKDSMPEHMLYDDGYINIDFDARRVTISGQETSIT